jgi:Lar family restriction alleviation protein
MNELKPCPFCGFTQPRVSEYASRFQVSCVVCHAQSGASYDKNDAIENWNTRAEILAEKEGE